MARIRGSPVPLSKSTTWTPALGSAQARQGGLVLSTPTSNGKMESRAMRHDGHTHTHTHTYTHAHIHTHIHTYMYNNPQTPNYAMLNQCWLDAVRFQWESWQNLPRQVARVISSHFISSTPSLLSPIIKHHLIISTLHHHFHIHPNSSLFHPGKGGIFVTWGRETKEGERQQITTT